MNIPTYDYKSRVYSYLSSTRQNLSVQTSMDAYERLHPVFNFGIFTLRREMFIALLLDKESRQLEIIKISAKSKPHIQVDINALLVQAEKVSAASVVIAHNSLSNNIQPSLQDNELTEVLRQECSKHLLVLKDHLIISEYGMFYSYADNLKIMR